MNRIQERSPLLAPLPAPGQGPGELRVCLVPFYSQQRTAILCAERFPKAPGWIFRIHTTKPARIWHRPGLRLELATGGMWHKPRRLQGLQVLTTAIPPGTLLTSACGEHDGPADIVLVVHVAFD